MNDWLNLVQQIDFARPGFALFLVEYESSAQRDAWLTAVQAALTERGMQTICLAPEHPVTDLLALVQQVRADLPVRGALCFQVTDLENSFSENAPLLAHLNLQRERYRQECPYPLVLWLAPDCIQTLARAAPDFWAWRSGVFSFSGLPSAELSDLGKVEDALQALSTVLSGPALEAARQPLLEKRAALLVGAGAIVIGKDNLAVGARGAAVGGDVSGGALVTGDRNRLVQAQTYVEKQIFAPLSSDDPVALRLAYLSRVYQQTALLSLSSVDPQAAGDAEARLSLSAIYTALLTLTPESDLENLAGQRKPSSRLEDPGREAKKKPLSAVAQLDQRPRLVLLGDPGSGKSTFVSFVALCLAGEILGYQDANLKILTTPLPEDEGDRQRARQKDESPLLQPWRHGPLLPVRVVLRDFAARGLPPSGQKAAARHLWDFIVSDLKDGALSAFERPLANELLRQGGLLLLDGLDEVPEAEQRRAQLRQAIEDFAAAFPRCRILVTSRTYAYQQQNWHLQGFASAILAPFTEGQIRRFIQQWYTYIASLGRFDHETAQGRAAQLQRAVFSSDRLRSLAERPLLLALMASLHAWRGGNLPEQRELLYANAVDLLLYLWERTKTRLDLEGNVVLAQRSLAELLKVERRDLLNLLNDLAFKAHAGQPDLRGTADIAEGDLVTGLMRLSCNRESEAVNPVELVKHLRDRAGLLIPRGVGVYTFPHRTFQEYLAACYLTDHGYPDEIAALARHDPERWREACLLAGAKASRGGAFALWALIDELCPDSPPETPPEKEPAWGALLAGLALAETADLSDLGRANLSTANTVRLGRVQRWLVHVIQHNALPALERAAAGDALAALGDPRFDPTRCFLPTDSTCGFVLIPPGSFLMGSRDKDEDAGEYEKPQHPIDIAYPYYLAKYPVTVAQLQLFVKETGRAVNPMSLQDPANHPARYVTWHDAVAYSQWLTDKLKSIGLRESRTASFWQGLLDGSLAVALPSEAEWEKAARGLLPLAGVGDGPRLYPWGDVFDPDCSNMSETGIGTTTPVGCFPKGASPYGLLDMSGNVWEWTRSHFKSYPYVATDGRENLGAGDNVSRVLRGGAFYDLRRLVRCACRSYLIPYVDWSSSGFRVGVFPIHL